MEPLSKFDDQNRRYGVTIIIFIGLLGVAMFALHKKLGAIPHYIPVYDFLILIVAGYRLVRLLQHDLIMRVVRDMFVHKRTFEENGEKWIERSKPEKGFERSLHDLFNCPWCLGIWVSYFVIFLYFLFPQFMYLIYVLALAGLASVIEVSSDLLITRSKIATEEKKEILDRTRGL
jgi:hypothetical protein